MQAGDHWDHRGENLPQADIQAVPRQQGPQGSQAEKVKGTIPRVEYFSVRDYVGKNRRLRGLP